MKKTLILPSAKLVPEELQNLGKLPAIIYPINQKIVFDYLYEQYGQECGLIKIICCEQADRVHLQLDTFASDARFFPKYICCTASIGDTLYTAAFVKAYKKENVCEITTPRCPASAGNPVSKSGKVKNLEYSPAQSFTINCARL